MEKSPNLVIINQYKSLDFNEKSAVVKRVLSEQIMCRASFFRKLRTASFTVLEIRYMSDLLKSIIDAREN